MDASDRFDIKKTKKLFSKTPTKHRGLKTQKQGNGFWTASKTLKINFQKLHDNLKEKNVSVSIMGMGYKKPYGYSFTLDVEGTVGTIEFVGSEKNETVLLCYPYIDEKYKLFEFMESVSTQKHGD